MNALKVKLVRSTIKSTESQIATVRCLKLRKIGQSVVVENTPATRGQIFKIQHLVEVSRV